MALWTKWCFFKLVISIRTSCSFLNNNAIPINWSKCERDLSPGMWRIPVILLPGGLVKWLA